MNGQDLLRWVSYTERQRIKALPGVLALYLSRVRPKHKNQLVTSQSELCLEGFPRSGNGFSLGLVRRIDGLQEIRIAHHTHSIANVRRAVDRGIPTFVLIREPEPCALSLLVFGACSSLADALCAYHDYYAGLLPLLAHVTVIPFETLTNDPQCFFDRMSETFGLNSPVWDEAAAAAIAKALAESDRRRQTPNFIRTSLPDSAKEQRKQALRAASPQARRQLDRCEAVRKRVLSSAPDVLGRG